MFKSICIKQKNVLIKSELRHLISFTSVGGKLPTVGTEI